MILLPLWNRWDHWQLLTLLGDFNMDVSTQGKDLDKVSDLYGLLQLEQLVTTPTRITMTSVDSSILNDRRSIVLTPVTNHRGSLNRCGTQKVVR